MDGPVTSIGPGGSLGGSGGGISAAGLAPAGGAAASAGSLGGGRGGDPPTPGGEEGGSARPPEGCGAPGGRSEPPAHRPPLTPRGRLLRRGGRGRVAVPPAGGERERPPGVARSRAGEAEASRRPPGVLPPPRRSPAHARPGGRASSSSREASAPRRRAAGEPAGAPTLPPVGEFTAASPAGRRPLPLWPSRRGSPVPGARGVPPLPRGAASRSAGAGVARPGRSAEDAEATLSAVDAVREPRAGAPPSPVWRAVPVRGPRPPPCPDAPSGQPRAVATAGRWRGPSGARTERAGGARRGGSSLSVGGRVGKSAFGSGPGAFRCASLGGEGMLGFSCSRA
ncbi:translation initiation factor IF-2-like [Crotalus tigris]|uniref:translation initiation factor IF-2-like n=1 Tax=Crotalus tigris TaxID=88082 RepID=UPI00192F3698|nr:translation initiation factor IF-2-like [Crotalus tigris]